jgi:hypothetical protein
VIPGRKKVDGVFKFANREIEQDKTGGNEIQTLTLRQD